LGALVAGASALPEEERLGDGASEEERERQKTFVTGLVRDWVRERMEEDAKAWLGEQEGVVLKCEESDEEDDERSTWDRSDEV
jgi:hypothetical protein